MKDSRVRQTKGQAIVEYILILAIVAGAALLIGTGIRRGVSRFWGGISNDVSRGCPSLDKGTACQDTN